MRHGKKVNHLGRTASHRKALLSNMASSLILNKRITTTVAKAKALRKYVEPLLTKAKTDTTHSRRTVFSYLQNKESVQTLFGEVASKINDRPGGYTRIIKLADVRQGDNAEMCLIELVDFNTLYTKDAGVKKAKTRRSRRGTKKATDVAETVETTTPEAEVVEEKEEKKKKPAKKAAKKTSKKSDKK
jgi:large subunit ribosomal protein L17